MIFDDEIVYVRNDVQHVSPKRAMPGGIIACKNTYSGVWEVSPEGFFPVFTYC